MKKWVTTLRIAISIIAVLSFISGAAAQSKAQDSLRVLITKYDNSQKGLEGVVTFSAVMEKDSSQMPVYIIGDSTRQFISELRVDAVNKVSYVSPSLVPKKLKKNFPNGFVMVELKNDQSIQISQVLPDARITQRQAFVTRLPFSSLDNTSGSFSLLADELVSSYGTDDQVFRVQQEDARNATPILAIDSLGHKAIVESLSDFKSGTIETIDAYDAVNAMKIIGDKGVNGLLVVLIKSSFTLKESLVSPLERLHQKALDLDRANYTTLVIRNPIIIK